MCVFSHPSVIKAGGSHCKASPEHNKYKKKQAVTLPETNVAPENGWLEYYFPIGEAYFQGLC